MQRKRKNPEQVEVDFEKDVFTPDEAAKHLGVATQTVYSYIRREVLDSYRLPWDRKHLYLLRTDVRNLKRRLSRRRQTQGRVTMTRRS